MEIKILDSIIHGALKPWKIDTFNTRRFTELVKKAKSAPSQTNSELLSQLSTLLADFPIQLEFLSKENAGVNLIQPLIFEVDLPRYKDAITHFYQLLITSEVLRIYNAMLQQSATWLAPVDIRYQVRKVLTNIRVLAKQVTIELNEQELTTVPDAQSGAVHFALYYLKHNLIVLYFSIQEKFKHHIDQKTTLEDFYLLDLEESLSKILNLELVGQHNGSVREQDKSDNNSNRFTFGFNGNKDKLNAVIGELCQKIELLNEEKTTCEMLLKIFTSIDLGTNTSKVYLSCETAQFRYIVDKLALHFTNLTLKAIEKSGVFYSKKGNLINAQNLSSGKIDNPKGKATIDRILNNMQ